MSSLILGDLLNGLVQVITNDGRVFTGRLRGIDQTTNLILENCHERMFSADEGVEEIRHGLYVIRGESVVLVGEIDEAKEEQTDLASIRADPIVALVH
ncbi:N(alpha)-acetyltransferase 38, NatC auxiliary [Allomyces javanicus]|nr:N(alpha)-acetyltransferase 38, NatC auxiliary [Allomyces javanicus]